MMMESRNRISECACASSFDAVQVPVVVQKADFHLAVGNHLLLADKPEEQKMIADGKVEIRFLDYDWNLNGIK